jgi:hypothetical protein
VARLFYRSNERGRVPLKLPAGRRQRRTSLVADEERATQLVFKCMNARADRRLADVKSIRGTDEVAHCNDREEGSGQFGVHWHVPLISIVQISSVDIIRLSKVFRGIDLVYRPARVARQLDGCHISRSKVPAIRRHA